MCGKSKEPTAVKSDITKAALQPNNITRKIGRFVIPHKEKTTPLHAEELIRRLEEKARW